MSELKRIYKALESPDLDFELWRASQYRYKEILDGGRRTVMPIWTDPYRSSFVTGTNVETIYTNGSVGTAKNTFTTEAVINDLAGMGMQPVLPGYFFLPGPETVGRGIRIVARGIYSTTAAPTWQTFVRIGAANATTGSNIGSIASTALGSTQTNLIWEYECDTTLVSFGSTLATTTMRSLGIFTAAMTASTNIALGIFGGGASPGTVATFDISAVNYINFTAACGTSSSSNSIQLLQLMVMGLN